MNAPETTSKGRPSLLSETAPGAPDNSSRILASLEGRVSAQQLPRRRSKKPWGIAALAAVVGVGALGAWQWQRAQDNGHPVATQAASHAAAGASAAVVSSASGASASAPQAAVIVTENTASSPNVTGSDPLSRALANGASSAASATAAGGASGAAAGASGKSSSAGKAVAPAQRESAKNRHADKVAGHGGKHGKDRSAAKHDDSDVDLLAALVARTKPYDPHAPQPGASDAKAAKGRPVSLAAQVKQCDKSNFFEAQLCRWRVCSDHWGKDPACPSANHTEQQTR